MADPEPGPNRPRAAASAPGDAWHDRAVSETGEQQPGGSSLADLVGEWLDWAAAGEVLGVSASRVGQLIKEHQLAAVVPRPKEGSRVPAELLADGDIVKGVPGVLTVLHDGGYDDAEALRWLFTPDDTLPGRPIDALRENRGSEVKRRAQAMAF